MSRLDRMTDADMDRVVRDYRDMAEMLTMLCKRYGVDPKERGLQEAQAQIKYYRQQAKEWGKQ